MDCPRLQHTRCSLFTAASTTDYRVMILRLWPTTTLTVWILHHGVLSPALLGSGAAGSWLLVSHPPPPPPPPMFHSDLIG